MINIGLVGLGYWGPNFIRIIDESGANLLWCCDISKKNLQKVKSKNKNLQTTTNIEDILNDKKVNAVVVAVPAVNHYEVTKKLILSGKDVLVEKPLASTGKEAKELVKLANVKKRILMVDHIFLFNPAIQKIREYVVSGELGEIFYGHGTYTALGPVRIDVSAMWDLAIHFIYTIVYLLDKNPTSVSAFGRGFLDSKNADVAFLNLEFPGKCIFNLKVSWLDPVKTRSLVLVGDKKMVIFDDTRASKVSLLDRGVNYNLKESSFPEGYRFILREGDIVLPHVRSVEPLKEVFEDFLRSIQNKKNPLVNPVDAINAITILEAAEYSLKNNGIKVYLKNSNQTNLLRFKR